jgi:probable HAF family extracellular repeat protein
MAGFHHASLRALCAALACAQGVAAADWTLVDLGTLGGRNAYAAAVSNGGRVAGCAETASGEIHAFAWYGGTMTDLGRGAEAAGNSCALAVNDAGAVAGRASSGELVIWSAGGVSGLGFGGEVGDMSDDGAVVGARASGGSTRAFVYRDGVLTELGPPSVRGEATAINARGQVVGSIDGRAFLYEDGALRDLGTLGGSMSVARAINSSGEIVGQSSNEFGQPTPFIHRGAMQALPGPSYSSAVAISASGRVAGNAEGTYGYVVSGNAVTPLSELPSVVASGWRRLEPTAMNDRGWIVGTAENREGDLRAFLLLPAPGSKPLRTTRR